MAETASLERMVVVRHGLRLEYFTIAWNGLEGLVAVVICNRFARRSGRLSRRDPFDR